MSRTLVHVLLPAIVGVVALLPFVPRDLARRAVQARQIAVAVAPSAESTAVAPASAAASPADADAHRPMDTVAKMLGGRPEDVQLTPEEQRLVALVNKEREDRGLTALMVAPVLVGTARDKSREMHDLNYWGHASPNQQKRTAMYRVLAALAETPKHMLVGENLYFCGNVLVDAGHQALMNSPSHRANILKPEYRYLGVGAYIAEDQRFWVTEHFMQINGD